MKKSIIPFALLVLLLCAIISAFKLPSGDHPTLAIGAKAPDFSL
jgi:hypothetical protein